MGDRLTQLQESLDKLTEMFYTSMGVLQRDAPLISVNDKPVELWKPEEIQQRKEETAAFSKQVSKDISETAVTIKFLISQLPYLDEAELTKQLKELDQEDEQLNFELDNYIQQAKDLLQ